MFAAQGIAILASSTTPSTSSGLLGGGGLPSWIAGLGALFGLIVLVAAAAAVLFSAAAKQRTEILEATNKTLTERVDFLEAEAARKDHEYETQRLKDQADHEKEKALAAQEKEALLGKVAVLEQVVTGREQLEHIQSLLEAHDNRVDTLATTINNNHATLTEHVATTREDNIAVRKALLANKRLMTSVLRELVKNDGGQSAQPTKS